MTNDIILTVRIRSETLTVVEAKWLRTIDLHTGRQLGRTSDWEARIISVKAKRAGKPRRRAK